MLQRGLLIVWRAKQAISALVLQTGKPVPMESFRMRPALRRVKNAQQDLTTMKQVKVPVRIAPKATSVLKLQQSRLIAVHQPSTAQQTLPQ